MKLIPNGSLAVRLDEYEARLPRRPGGRVAGAVDHAQHEAFCTAT